MTDYREQVDVLVIGGGIAGLFAAIKAKTEAPAARVMVVDKATPGASGCSVFAAGILNYWQPGDDLQGYQQEIIRDNSELLIDPQYVADVLQDSYQVFLDLQRFGVQFMTNTDGQIKRLPSLASSFGYCSPYRRGGPHLMWQVRQEAARLGVELKSRVVVTDLLVHDGVCLGAVGFHGRTGEFQVYQAGATVLAAGTSQFNKAPMGTSGSTGDGVALAYRAGVELRNMEQSGYATIGPKGMNTPTLHLVFGSGGLLVNSLGERIMERYSPLLKEESRRFDLARAILLEWVAGRGPCYVDCTHLPQDKIDTIRQALPLYTRSLAAQGKDLARDRIEYIPYSFSFAHVGGAAIRNAAGEVNINGLWVVGYAGDFAGGLDSTAAGSLSGSAAQGARAGRRAAVYAQHGGAVNLDAERVTYLRQRALSYFLAGSSEGNRVDRLTLKFLSVAFQQVNLLKEEGRLRLAAQALTELEAEIQTLKVADPHELRKVHDLVNMMQLTQVSIAASLLRTESRRAHFRLDYPQRDDINWLKWIFARQEEGRMQLWITDLPFAVGTGSVS